MNHDRIPFHEAPPTMIQQNDKIHMSHYGANEAPEPTAYISAQPLPGTLMAIFDHARWDLFRIRLTVFSDHATVEVIEAIGPGETKIHSVLTQNLPPVKPEWEECVGCHSDYTYGYICRCHSLCGLCHESVPIDAPPHNPASGVSRCKCPRGKHGALIFQPGCDEHPSAHNASSVVPEYLAPMEPRYPCRQLETRHCPASYNGLCGDRPCARYESEDEAPWLPELKPHNPPDADGFVNDRDSPFYDGLPTFEWHGPDRECGSPYQGSIHVHDAEESK